MAANTFNATKRKTKQFQRREKRCMPGREALLYYHATLNRLARNVTSSCEYEQAARLAARMAGI